MTATEVNEIISQRNEVRYYPSRQKAEAGIETLRASEIAHGRTDSRFSLGKNGRQHFVLITRVEVA